MNHKTVKTTKMSFQPGQPADTLHGSAEEQGPLVRQPAASARLARILHHSAQDLWELCTLADTKQMQDEAHAIASRILASCPSR
jgi:hypothetical protein